MFTPQQIEQISFSRATFGGYDMQSVDELLYPLTEDYKTLYKENALLKSKMKVLVSKLEEYRANEASMKDAIVNAQKTCDLMVKEAEEKSKQLLAEASATALENAKNADAMIAAEEARVDEARRVAAEKIDALKSEISACINALDRIKATNMPVHSAPAAEVETVERTEADDVADEIAATLQAIVGPADPVVPTAEPKHPASESTTSKFSNLGQNFGQNYNPTKR